MENIQNQPVQESTEQQAQTTATEETVDYEALYKAEVLNSKKLRKRSQDAELKLDANSKAQTEAEEAKLIEDGKLKTLLDKRDGEIKILKAKANEYDALVTSEREAILENMSDEDKEQFGDLPLKQLKALSQKLSDVKPAQQTNPILSGATKNNISSKPFAEMTEEERREWHSQMVK